jgi:small redox-active disulfide protein 2
MNGKARGGNMKNVKILGIGCAICKTTQKMLEDIAKEKGIEVQIEKIEDIQKIMAYGVMSTPAIVIDDKVIHEGGIPSRKKIEELL